VGGGGTAGLLHGRHSTASEAIMAWGAKDIRTARRGNEMLAAIVETGSLVLRRIGGGRAGEVAAGRFLDNDDVSVAAIMATAAERTRAAAKGRIVLAVHDTTEVNFKDRSARRTGLGPAGDGVSRGFFPKTMAAGWQRLMDRLDGFTLAMARKDV
jgi:hypothetical protein